MRKLLWGVLCVLLLALLLVACSDSSSSKDLKTVKAYFKGYTVTAEKSLSNKVEVSVKDDSELYWTYIATKDGGGTGSEKNLNGGNPGLPEGAFGEFVYGTYTFKFNAYESYENGTYGDLYYSGLEKENVLNASNNSVYGSVTRNYAEGTTGSLVIQNLVTYQADELEGDATSYDINVTLVSLTNNVTYVYSDDDNEMLDISDDSDGFVITLDPDYYTLTIELTAEIDGSEEVIATGVAERIYVIKGGTTTVTGSITEYETVSLTLVVTVGYTDENGDYQEESIYDSSSAS